VIPASLITIYSVYLHLHSFPTRRSSDLIYGALRGKAVAGARGEVTARVFCQEFQAELVSIAGVFRVFETIPAELAGKPVQAWLEDRKSTRLNSSHVKISYAVFCLQKKSD